MDNCAPATRKRNSGMNRSSETSPAANGKKILLSMGTTYAMGTFNDNFFKQAALLLAASAGLESIQGIASAMFALPFVVCSAWAGWLADRLPKNRMVVWSKVMELAAMLYGVWAMVSTSWTGMVAVVFLMGLQSTIFSPALNGAIPENFSAAEVPKVNALLKLATTATILLGIAAGGMVLDLPDVSWGSAFVPQGEHGFGRLAVGGVAVFVAVVGVAAAFGIGKSVVPAGANAPFPLLGPVHSVLHALECRRKDPQLFLTLAGEAFFYCLSSFALLCINNLGIAQLGFSLTVTSLLSVALMIGICIGSVLAGRYEATSWRRFMVPACAGLGLGLMVSGLSPLLPKTLQFPYLFLIFTFSGICGGLYLIPLVSFIQVKPGAAEKGKTLGISNFSCFSGILLSGLVFAWLGKVPPAWLLAGCGCTGLLFTAWACAQLARLFPHGKVFSLIGGCLRLLLSLRYRITATGLEAVHGPGPILFMPNHPALIDPIIVYSLVARYAPRPLADERQMEGPMGRLAAKALHAVLIPDAMKDGAMARQGVAAGMQAVLDALRGGDNVLLYPAGRIYRSASESLGGNSGAALIMQKMPEVRVVLVRTTGLWGSSFSYGATGKAPHFGHALLRGALAVCANLLFFTPRRAVSVEFAEAADIPRNGDKRELNAWLEQFYNKAERPAQAIPRFFWQGSKARTLPAVAPRRVQADADIPAALREAVYAALREASGLPHDHALTEAMTLGGDLGLDSLALMDLALNLETAHGKSIPSLELLVTVHDCLLAACGLLGEADVEAPAPAGWFAPAAAKMFAVPDKAATIADAFLAQVRAAPGQPLLADRAALRSRRDILLGALILARRLQRLPGERLGIMLPAAPAVVTVWLAAQLAGKTPVLFNWTVGEANLRHCIRITGVSHILSASPLQERLERQGTPLSTLPVQWVLLDKLAATLSMGEKLCGALKARLLRNFRKYAIPQTAAVLFTSGSESLPKAVPLSHANLLSNARDITAVLHLAPDDSVLAMLPPFHSFGLMVNIVLPLSLGIRAAFHPNPTEPGPLAALMCDYKLTLMASPPTFLGAVLDRAAGTENLASLRYAFVGAEKCPEHVYQAFAGLCPQAALCEGYGITECSPVVSVNRPGNIQPGTIGHAMPSVTLALVREENGSILARAKAGQTGMLLVRGPSIFGGYLGDAPWPFVAFEGHIWYRTGDLASMDETGRMTFRGRLKRFVKIGGEMISLPQIETVLLEVFGKRSDAPQEGPALAVEATPEETGAAIVLFTPMPLSLAEVNAALRAAGLSSLYAVKRIATVAAVPLLGSGKTDYRALADSLKTV